MSHCINCQETTWDLGEMNEEGECPDCQDDAVRKYAHQNKDKINICEDCKNGKKTEFHHLSYVPNISVELCKKCHNSRHWEVITCR